MPDSPLPPHLLPMTAGWTAEGRLSVGGVDVLELVDSYGTPLFVYDEEHLRHRCREAVDAFGDGVAYASKAFLCRAMAALVYEEGMCIDVSTAGELHVALAAGVPPDRLVLHGNNKSHEELARSAELGVGRIVVDAFEDIDRLEGMVVPAGSGPGHGSGLPRVLVRVTPGIEAHTHEYVRTGQEDTKFGFSLASGAAEAAVNRVRSSPALELVGLHMHVGSQVFLLSSFMKAVEVVASFFNPLGLPELCVGGGLGVAYVEGEEAPTIREWATAVKEACFSAGIPGSTRVTAEPGRAIAAAAAITLYRVGTVKHLPGIRTYVAVDGGMSDNPRPVLYGSGYEAFLPRSTDARRTLSATVVGKHCESGDVIVRDARLPADLAMGEVLATPVTGAYGHSMASNYNKVPRAPVVFVSDGRAKVVVRRESLDDLLRMDS